ncbi:MAG: hypothetical protein V8Q84_03990 [Bilophila sp.]
MFLRFLAALVPLLEAGRTWLDRRRADAARRERARDPVRLLCRRLGGSPIIPPPPVLTSLRPLTLDGTDGAWMDWRDAGTLDAWLESVGVAP